MERVFASFLGIAKEKDVVVVAFFFAIIDERGRRFVTWEDKNKEIVGTTLPRSGSRVRVSFSAPQGPEAVRDFFEQVSECWNW